jgi:peroxiredoxin
MKRFILSISVISVLFFMSCKDSEDIGFKISGKISGAEGKNLILNKFTTTEALKIDTVLLDANGAFEFKSTTGSLELYSLQLDNDPVQILLMVDSTDQIVVNADGTDMRGSYTVSGSTHTALAKELYDHFDEAFFKIDSVNRLYLSNPENAHPDSVREEIGKYIEDHKNYSIKFIEKNIYSPAAILALYQSFGRQAPIFPIQQDRAIYQKVNEVLMDSFPNSEFVNGLNTFIISNPPVPTEGNPAPDISLQDPDGKVITLSSLKGQYVLLDFWAAWCKPCRMENPTVLENYNKYKNDNFTIYQVSLDRQRSDWVEAIEKDGLSDWYHVSDLKYWQSEAAALYGVRGIPANFLIDPEGIIVASNLRGPNLGKTLREIFGH